MTDPEKKKNGTEPTKEGRVHASESDANLQRKMEGKDTPFQQRLRKAESTGEGNFMWEGEEKAARGTLPTKKVTETPRVGGTPKLGGIEPMPRKKTPTEAPSKPVGGKPYKPRKLRSGKKRTSGVPWNEGLGQRNRRSGYRKDVIKK